MIQKVYKILWWAFFLITIFLIIFFCGDPSDETEHLAATCLIFNKGLSPFVDFFEHHSPYIWYLLGTYFYIWDFKPSNGGLFFYGRFLVVLSFLASWIPLLIFYKKISKNREFLPPVIFLWLPYLMFFNVFFVVRPETFGFPLVIIGLIFYYFQTTISHKTRKIIYTLLSGVFLGLAGMFSVRYVAILPFLPFINLYSKPNTNTKSFGKEGIFALFMVIFSAILVVFVSKLHYINAFLTFEYSFTKTLMMVQDIEKQQGILDVLTQIKNYLAITSLGWGIPVLASLWHENGWLNFWKQREIRLFFAILAILIPMNMLLHSFWSLAPESYSHMIAFALFLSVFVFAKRIKPTQKGLVSVIIVSVVLLLLVSAAVVVKRCGFVMTAISKRNAFTQKVAPFDKSALMPWDTSPVCNEVPFYYSTMRLCNGDWVQRTISSLRQEGYKAVVPPYSFYQDITEYLPDYISETSKSFIPTSDWKKLQESTFKRCYTYTEHRFEMYRPLRKPRVGTMRGYVLKPECIKLRQNKHEYSQVQDARTINLLLNILHLKINTN